VATNDPSIELERRVLYGVGDLFDIILSCVLHLRINCRSDIAVTLLGLEVRTCVGEKRLSLRIV
jgi:hypothetical protein